MVGSCIAAPDLDIPIACNLDLAVAGGLIRLGREGQLDAVPGVRGRDDRVAQHADAVGRGAELSRLLRAVLHHDEPVAPVKLRQHVKASVADGEPDRGQARVDLEQAHRHGHSAVEAEPLAAAGQVGRDGADDLVPHAELAIRHGRRGQVGLATVRLQLELHVPRQEDRAGTADAAGGANARARGGRGRGSRGVSRRGVHRRAAAAARARPPQQEQADTEGKTQHEQTDTSAEPDPGNAVKGPLAAATLLDPAAGRPLAGRVAVRSRDDGGRLGVQRLDLLNNLLVLLHLLGVELADVDPHGLPSRLRRVALLEGLDHPVVGLSSEFVSSAWYEIRLVQLLGHVTLSLVGCVPPLPIAVAVRSVVK